MFINRAKELAALETSWENNRASLIICYGRRRVGKTELIKQFLEDKPGLYFLADRLSEQENLRVLTRLAGDFFNDPFLGEFADWYAFFSYLKAKATNKIVVVVDEFPYLVETNKALSSVFQKGWDEMLQKLPVMLILCGSSIGMMERETLTYGAPLYGRRTKQLFVQPLTFADFSEFFPGLGFDRRLEFFAMTGGIPAYIKQLEAKSSARQNFLKNVLEPEAYLYGDAEFILKEETREPRQYFSILRAIALGKHKFGEITNETGFEKTSLHKYLYYLDELQIIQKRFPSTEKDVEKSRQGLYFLADNYFSFWFDMVFPYRSELVLGNKRPALARFDQAFVHHAAAAYEQAGGEILRRFQEDLFPFSRLGKWWQKNQEIDIVAIGDPGEDILFAEVKWSTKKVGIDIYQQLEERSKLVPGDYRRKHYALLSCAGFTAAMEKLAREKNVLLIHGERKV
jgi:hypothetical protein